MKIAERYTTARNTSDLSVNERTTHSPSDVLGATGMAAQENEAAMKLWDVTFNGKTGSKIALVEMLASKLAGQMVKSRWKGDPRKIAQEVVAWHLYGTCQPCGGRRYETIPGAPTLSDKLCRHCGGTGKVRLPRGEAHSWLSDYMDRLISQAGGQVMKKLAFDMNL